MHNLVTTERIIVSVALQQRCDYDLKATDPHGVYRLPVRHTVPL